MTSRHDYPELVDAKPAPVEQAMCWVCSGSGWRESYVDDLGHGHGWKCVMCSGRGYIWVEVPQ